MDSIDITAALRSLEISREEGIPDLAWLATSQERPAPFWAALVDYVGRTGPALRTRPGVAYDLFYDAVHRHVAASRTAFVAFDRSTGWVALSYAELGTRASICAAAWSAQGIGPGARVAIVLPMGIPWLVAFSAALRLGAIASFLEPSGARSLVPRLDGLAPVRVVFDSADPPPLGAWADKALAVVMRGPPSPDAPSAYAPADPCALLFSPLRSPPDGGGPIPVALPAEVAWQNALRDGVFVYRAGAGDRVALPGFPLQEVQPAAILATLLAGATFVHVNVADVEARPALLEEQAPTTLGITRALRDVLCDHDGPRLISPKLWIKNIADPFEPASWRKLVQRKLPEVPTANVLLDAAAGGAVLFSCVRRASVNVSVLPGPGRPYVLFDATSRAPAKGGTGVFVPQPGDLAKDGWFILSRSGEEAVWIGTVTPRRSGGVFPAAEVEDLVATLPHVTGAATVSAGDEASGWKFVLVVFAVREGTPSAIELQRTVDAAIRTRLSAAHAPDEILIAPLYPHRKGGKVDIEWCRPQYSTGALQWKAGHPIFQKLTALRRLVVGQ